MELNGSDPGGWNVTTDDKTMVSCMRGAYRFENPIGQLPLCERVWRETNERVGYEKVVKRFPLIERLRTAIQLSCP